MPPVARLVSINRSHGGVPKTPLLEALVTVDGLDGDRQRYHYHGGPDRAVVVYSLEVIEALRREGHPIGVGTTGENFTVSGLDWAALAPGAELQVGAVRLQFTKFATPCATIAGAFLGEDISRIAQAQHPGWSRLCARVLVGGIVRTGDLVAVVATDAALIS
jgi:MOSC domain-containing protein YiiM